MFRKYRWIIVLMLFLAAGINYIDRSALSIALPILSKKFHLTASEAGIVLSSFFIGYAIFNFIGGLLSDVVGPKKVFGWAMTLWSIFCGLTAITFNFASLFIVRILFGFGEGPLSSTANKTVNNWIPLRERARAVGINQAGAPLGGAITGPIVGLIALHWGWQYSFVAITIVGLLWTLVWIKVSSDTPETNRMVSREELLEIESNMEDESAKVQEKPKKIPLGTLLRQRTVLLCALGMFGYNYVLFFFLTWFPSYLVMAKHMSIAKMSVVTMIPWIAGALGQIAGSFLIDYIYKLTGKVLFSRKIVLVTCLTCSAVCVGLTGLAGSVTGVITLMTIGVCFLYLQAPTYWAIIQDTVPKENVGAASGFMHGLANISGIVGPTVTGFIVQYTGKFTSAFLLAGCLALIGALAVGLFVKPIRTQNFQKVPTVEA